jgi:aflatoxin B1 aldehyde reductase
MYAQNELLASKLGRINMDMILGTMTFGESVFGADATAMIKAFLEAGYKELDTAYVYNNGQSEIIIGEALKNR